MAEVGIIGGSGLYQMDGVTDLAEVHVDTPFGKPSDALLIGRLDGVEVAFLPRHGRGHRIPPHELPFRANLWALKSVGVKWVLSVSAVGSLREEIAPGHLVVVDQFIDRMKKSMTFFEDGLAAHVPLADPVCPVLREALAAAAGEVLSADEPWHRDGTYVCIEGPQFSTRAESNLYRSWGASVVGMTNLPEARLAREAELAYASLAMATDYDCWHEHHDDVTVEAVLAVLRGNVEKAQRVIRAAVQRIGGLPPSPAFTALEHAIMTAPHLIPQAARERLALLIDHRLPKREHTP
jgi:5'-methylthioadenosine phosphorylase